jgi:hypothetical protein
LNGGSFVNEVCSVITLEKGNALLHIPAYTIHLTRGGEVVRPFAANPIVHTPIWSVSGFGNRLIALRRHPCCDHRLGAPSSSVV